MVGLRVYPPGHSVLGDLFFRWGEGYRGPVAFFLGLDIESGYLLSDWGQVAVFCASVLCECQLICIRNGGGAEYAGYIYSPFPSLLSCKNAVITE